MKKPKEITFADGTKKLISEGDTVYVVSGQHRGGGRTKTVDKIGNKILKIGRDEFYLENGLQKTEYTADRLYASEEEYKAETRLYKLNLAFKRKVSESFRKKYSIEQIKQCAEILGLDIPELE